MLVNTHRQRGANTFNTRRLLHTEIRRHLTRWMHCTMTCALQQGTYVGFWRHSTEGESRYVWRKLTEPQTPSRPRGHAAAVRSAQPRLMGLSGNTMMVPGFEREFPHTGLPPSSLRKGGPSIAKRGAGRARSRPHKGGGSCRAEDVRRRRSSTKACHRN